MATITEDYVSLETAKLLKQKGFDIICDKIYRMNGYLCPFEYGINIKEEGYYLAPTLQIAMKWLRKNHQIFIRPNTSFLYPIKWYSEIFCYGDNLKTQQDVKTEYYDSPEESYEAALKYCLEHLI